MFHVIGWLTVGLGTVIVLMLPVAALLVARSRFRFRLRTSQSALWRLLPIWLLTASVTACLGFDLMPGVGEPRWLRLASLILAGMVFWSGVETVLSTFQERSAKKSHQETLRRDRA